MLGGYRETGFLIQYYWNVIQYSHTVIQFGSVFKKKKTKHRHLPHDLTITFLINYSRKMKLSHPKSLDMIIHSGYICNSPELAITEMS